MASAMAGSVKLGQPVPESNFVLELKSSLPHAAQRYIPSSFECTYLPVKGGSVPCRRITSYSSGVSSWRHSSSDFSTLVLSMCVLLSEKPTRTAHRHRGVRTDRPCRAAQRGGDARNPARQAQPLCAGAWRDGGSPSRS